MTYFLEKIASHIYESYGDSLEAQCMVFPNRRAGLYFLKYLSARAGKPIWSPAVKTINELFGLSSTLKLAESETLIFELYKTYKDLNPGAENFDDFYFWGELLLNDFDDIDKYLADSGKLFENLADIRKIDEKFGGLTPEQLEVVKQFWVNFSEGSRTSEKEDFLRIWSLLPRLYTNFRKSLSDKGIAYEGMIFRELAGKCLEGHLPEYNWKNFHFAGFNALNSCEKILLHTLKDAGLAKFYWDYDISYTEKDKGHSAGFFIRDNLKEFGNDMPSDWQYISKLSSDSENFKSRIIETSSDIAQVKLIPELLGTLDGVNGQDSHHTAIVLAEESLLVPLLSTIPESVNDVNVTMGYPLRFSPVYSLVHHLLSLQKNCREERNEAMFDHTDVLNLLRHNFFTVEQDQSGSKLVSELVGEKRQWIAQSRFAGLSPYDIIFKRAASPQLLSEYIRSVLETFYITDIGEQKGGTYSGSEINIRNEFIYRTLLSINRLDNIISESGTLISTATWTKLFDRIIRGISIPFSGEPLNGIQIMGILETRALDFRNLIILSVNEGTLPRSSAGSSYIPYNLREAFGLPGIKHQDSIYAYYFYRLLHRVDNVTFVYNANSEGIRTGEMSRFLLQLNYLSRSKPEMSGLGCEIVSPARQQKLQKRSGKYSEKMESLFMGSKGKSLSPSAVNTWLSCRMKFFYKYICNLKEPEKILTEIDPAMFGALLHGIMQKIYTPSVGKTISSSTVDELLRNEEGLEATVKDVINNIYFNGKEAAPDGNIMIISNILKSYAKMILRFDKSVTPLKIAGLEQSVYSRIEINYKGRKTDINAGGYIDRLDFSEGKYRIIDYKTGNVPMEIRSVESLFDETDDKRSEAWFQILMYCELFSAGNMDSAVRPSLYALRNLAVRGFSDHLIIAADKDSKKRIDDYTQIREEYSSGLHRTIESIFDPEEDFTMTEHLRKCDYCTFRQLCSR